MLCQLLGDAKHGNEKPSQSMTTIFTVFWLSQKQNRFSRTNERVKIDVPTIISISTCFMLKRSNMHRRTEGKMGKKKAKDQNGTCEPKNANLFLLIGKQKTKPRKSFYRLSPQIFVVLDSHLSFICSSTNKQFL